MSSQLFDSKGRMKRLDQPQRDPGVTRGSVRALYVIAVLSIFVPLRSSTWVGLAVGGHWLSPLGFVSLGIVALGIWRIAVVVRDPRRLDAPVDPGPLRWCRALGVGLMATGTVVFVLQFFVGPIGRALFPRGSDNGVEFFAVGLWLAVFTVFTPIGVFLFESSRLLSFERWYRERQS